MDKPRRADEALDKSRRALVTPRPALSRPALRNALLQRKADHPAVLRRNCAQHARLLPSPAPQRPYQVFTGFFKVKVAPPGRKLPRVRFTSAKPKDCTTILKSDRMGLT